jgi:hypothetical protein
MCGHLNETKMAFNFFVIINLKHFYYLKNFFDDIFLS